MAQKILIADDEAYIRILMEQTLEELEDEGVEFFFAENGRQALELAIQEQPQLIFLDVMMPYVDGLEVCRQIKIGLKLEKSTVVLLTAKGQESDKIKAREVGADAYITKPFDPDLLLKMAKEILFSH